MQQQYFLLGTKDLVSPHFSLSRQLLINLKENLKESQMMAEEESTLVLAVLPFSLRLY